MPGYEEYYNPQDTEVYMGLALKSIIPQDIEVYI